MKTPASATASAAAPGAATAGGCPRCQASIPADAPAGLCPRCLLDGAATATEDGTGNRPASARPPSLAEVAEAFPDLEVSGFLGAGGMGCVYRVRDRASGGDAALKILPRELAADPAFLERFEREARTLARLRHPHVVGVRRHGQSGGFCYLLMEFVDGANLRQAMRAGRFTPAQALALVPDLCDALQYAHAQGVLHRDIKPENILLDAEGRVKIADFGIAKIVGEPGQPVPDAFRLTHTGARVGTPHYMAPEQVERPDSVDHRADIYSLGVVCYELLTGELPLGRFPAPSTKAALDARIDEIVFRALAKERELRQQSAGQVKEEIAGLEGPSRKPAPAAPEVGGLGFRILLMGVGIVWLGTLLAMVVGTGSFESGLAESIRAVPVILSAALAFALLNRALRTGTRRSRFLAAAMGLLVIVSGWTLYPRSGLPLLLRPARTPEANAALAALGIHLRSSFQELAGGGVRLPSDLSSIPPSLRLDPVTRLPFILLAPGQTNPPLAAGWVATPPRPHGLRQVLFGDGSVHTVSEDRFWELVLQARPEASLGPTHIVIGPPLPESTAEAAVLGGAVISRSAPEGLRHLQVNLASALHPVRDGRFDSAAKALHGMLASLPFDPDREILFTLHPTLVVAAPKPDFHEKTQSRHGGLLAMLAAFAARARDTNALAFALAQGAPLWTGREELLLCERRLDGESDQDWEEVRMRTADVLSLQPGSPTPMTVIRRFKASGPVPTTNHVECAWPRQR